MVEVHCSNRMVGSLDLERREHPCERMHRVVDILHHVAEDTEYTVFWEEEHHQHHYQSQQRMEVQLHRVTMRCVVRQTMRRRMWSALPAEHRHYRRCHRW